MKITMSFSSEGLADGRCTSCGEQCAVEENDGRCPDCIFDEYFYEQSMKEFPDCE